MNVDLSRLKIDRRGAEKAPRRRWSLLIGAGVLIAVLCLLLLSRGEEAAEPAAPRADAPTAETPARAAAPTATQGAVLHATGYVVAQRQAAVASQATGRLIALYVEEGDSVEEGAVLGRLESEGLEAAVREQEAALLSAAASVKFAEAELADAAKEQERVLGLRKEQVESQRQADAAVARFLKARAELQRAQAAEALAQAQLDRAKVELSYSEIRAPFPGTVLTKNADIGEIVAPFGSSSTARAAIVTLADLNSLEVEADVSESNLQKVFVGQECEITLDSLPGRSYRGVVSKIVPTVDRAKATVMTKIRFLERDDLVIPEMSAKIAFLPNTVRRHRHGPSVEPTQAKEPQ